MTNMIDLYEQVNSFGLSSTLKLCLPTCCFKPSWMEVWNPISRRYNIECQNCYIKLTKQQYHDIRASYINATKGAKPMKVTKGYEIPKTTNFQELKPYLTCQCGNPQWYVLYHINQNSTSAKCAHCMRSLTEKQFNEANALMLLRQKENVNMVPVDTDIKVSDHRHDDYKLEDTESELNTKTLKDLVMDDKVKVSYSAKIKDSKYKYKFDGNKIRVALLKRFGLALLAIAELTTKGAEKYLPHSWTLVPDGVDRYDDALFGHYLCEMFSKEDPETKVPLEVTTAWNALARLQLLIDRDSEWKSRLMQRNMT